MFKDIRDVIKERAELSVTDPKYINPLIISTCAAMTYSKLRQSLKQALLLRTSVDVNMLREYLYKAQAISQTEKKSETELLKNNKDTGAFKSMERVLS